MKVVHLGNSYTGGGAALTAFRLHTGLRAMGTDPWIVVAAKSSDDRPVLRSTSVVGPQLAERLGRFPRRLLRTENQRHVSSAWSGASAWRNANRRQPPISRLRSIGNGFRRLQALPKPTGTLVRSLGACSRYRVGCLKSNRLGFGRNRWVWETKRRAWAGIAELTFFFASDWLADRTVGSLQNTIDPMVVPPRAPEAARRNLGLLSERYRVLFGAIDSSNDKRKRFGRFAAALRQLRGGGVALHLVVFGNSPQQIAAALPGFATYCLGRISDPARLAAVYFALDVMVVRSERTAASKILPRT